MRFLFFDAAGTILFERNDAESANVTHEEMSLQVLFPYADQKVVLRGMRIGYEDSLGVFQVYEIRKVKTYEPDHYQEITAEHICISELTDEFFADAEWTDITASAALSELLTGTLWNVGTSSVSNTSSANIANGNVWSDIRTIEKSWNVRILPRVTVNSAGITGRYLDIIGTEGTWRGLRLSLDKNADEVGVTWDDSRLKTALYAFGKSVEQTIAGEKVMKPITFADVVWSTADGDPVNKPLGQEYLEDTAATAAYGRNGRARFAYYQNGDISDPEILLEKTWESLQTLNHPDVTVDCLVSDLYRLGYVDVPLRLYDIALVEIRPTGAIITKQIVQYSEDLLNPTQSRLCIGTYIPNIIYINRETEKAAGGGGGGGGGQKNGEYERQEFETAIQYNEYQISLRATQYDLNQTDANVAAAQSQITIAQTGISSICTGTGAQLNPDGTLKVDAQGNPIFVDQNNCLYTKISQNATDITLEANRASTAEGDLRGAINVEAGKITQIVTAVGSNGQVTAASIVAAVNSSGSSVVISADHIDLQGVVTADSLATDIADIETLAVQELNATGDVDVGGNLAVYGDASFPVGNTLTCGALACGNLDCDGISIGGSATVATNFIVSASVSGNVLTLTPLSGNAITFSKATTLTSGWSSGAYTVTATQNSEIVGTNVTALTNTGHWGSGSGEDPNKYYYATYATINGGATPVATGNTTIIDATARYNAGASSVTISSATRTNESNSALSGDSSIGTAGYKYIVITATASNGATRTIAVNATPTYDAGVTAGEGKFSLADIRLQGSSLSRKTTGYLYPYMSSDPVGYGSWFLTSNLNTTTLYYQGTRYTDTYYTKASS